MRLIFVRHGRTESNSEKILDGHLHGEISPEGRKQAELLAERLKSEKPTAIYSSDLKRARDTAEILGKHHNVEIFPREELREIDWGSYTGKKKHEVDRTNPPADAETLEDFQKRVAKFYEEIKEKHMGETVFFIAHSWTNKILLTHIRKQAAAELHNMYSSHNTSVNIVNVKNESEKIELENCAAHLD